MGKPVLKIIFFIGIVCSFWIFQKATAETSDTADSNILTPMIEDDTPPQAPAHTESQSDFSVKTKRIKGASKLEEESRAITALSPEYKATFTPGAIEFSWKVSSSKIKKSVIVVENLETDERTSHVTTKKNLSISLAPGRYRWQVTGQNSKAATRWRFLEVLDAPSPVEISLKSDRLQNVDGATTEYEPKVAHDDVSAIKNSQGDDRKLQEYKNKKLEAEKQAKDVELQVKAAQTEALRAMRVAKEQQLRLQSLMQEKLKAEKLEKLRLAKIENERLAKIRAAKLEREKERKLLASKERDVKLAQAKVDKAKEKFKVLVIEAKKARSDLELAYKTLAEKTDVYKQASIKLQNSDDSGNSDRAPASETSEKDIQAAPPAVQAPPPSQPARSRRHEDSDIKWSDEK